MVNLEVSFAGLKFRNPLMNAACPISRDAEMMKKLIDAGVGGVVAKTISVVPAIVPRPSMAVVDRGVTTGTLLKTLAPGKVKATPVPNLGSYRVFYAMLNAELWSDIPHEHYLEREYPLVKKYAVEHGVPFIVSIGYKPDELRLLGPKVQNAGADAISAINTIRALYIDIDRRGPLLSNKVGGMSGWCIKPIAIRCVAEIALLIRKLKVDVPIIGIGGIYSGRDAIEMMMAGACCVGVGTAIMHYGMEILGKIVREIEDIMDEKGFNTIDDIVGCALDEIEKCKILG